MQAEHSWSREGDNVLDLLKEELDRPGGKANVIHWFIDTRFAGSGAPIGATNLINGSNPTEIDEAFERIVTFVETQGDAGAELGNKLKSANRNLINNYKV